MNQFANNFTNGGFKVYQRDYEWLVMVDGGTEPLVFLGDELTFKLGA
jgi:hypothetical protein